MRRGRIALALTGKRFGRLVVLRQVSSGVVNGSCWLCECDCGGYIVAVGGLLNCGQTKSCGCLRSEAAARRNRVHGCSGSRLHSIWKNMKTRCFNTANRNYEFYGGRGITVCPEWANDFAAFAAYVGDPPEGKTLDRFPNNDGNYEPGNVRWARPEQQANNRRPRKTRAA